MLEKKTRGKPIPMTTRQMKGVQVKRSEMATTIVVAARQTLIFDGCSKFISGATISTKMSSNSSSNSQLLGKVTTVVQPRPSKTKIKPISAIISIIRLAQFPLFFFFFSSLHSRRWKCKQCLERVVGISAYVTHLKVKHDLISGKSFFQVH